MTPSARAQIITRRTYNRPTDDTGKNFETWEQTVDRVIGHQEWLWSRAQGYELSPMQHDELTELRDLMLERRALPSGRTLWLGGTEVAKRREASQFNCSFTRVETVYDVVDVLWLLLQGCGVGFEPIIGQLTGFNKRIPEVETIRSTRTAKGGDEFNEELWDGHTWTIRIGDSAESWAKSIGKLMAGRFPAKKLVLDFTQIRPAGERLAGYGWISSGDDAICRAYLAIAEILNRRAGCLLSRMDILDVINWLGTVLSSRRSAEIALMPFDSPEWKEFAQAKQERDPWNPVNPQRQQSNNSLVFYRKPAREDLEEIFSIMEEAGGSEPGFINGKAALARAPWFRGVNPCAEILLGNKSFCNLTEVDVGKYLGDQAGLERAIYIIARANYRQTCVNLLDGVLQEAWHLNNEFLRLCGVGLTGIAKRPDLSPYDYQVLQRLATAAAYDMADELDMPRPKNVTTVKPSGTLSKIMDTTSGVHKPVGRYEINKAAYHKGDPMIDVLRDAGYNVMPKPHDPDGVLVDFPVYNEGVELDHVDGVELNAEAAVSQLERYKKLQNSWSQQNVSCTISYSPEEVPAIIDWLLANWDSYVGVSFLYRTDATKTAEDLGYAYLPQQPVTRDYYEEYMGKLSPVDLDSGNSLIELEDDECASGVCPVR